MESVAPTGFPAAMMALTRAAAEGGPRRHRTIAKPGPRQQCPLPASGPREPRAPALRAGTVSRAAALLMIVRAVVAGRARPEAGARHRAPVSQAVRSGA